MDFFTHAIFGALMYILFLKEVTFDFFFLAIICAVLPDLDIFLSPLRRVFKSNYLEHRGGSHSYIVGIMISVIIGIIYSLLTSNSFFISWMVASFFYGLHITMDLLTTTKIPYLFPLTKKEYSFYIEKAGSFFTMLSCVSFLVLLILVFINPATFILFPILINAFTLYFLIYYAVRITTKILISSNLDSNQKYLPGVLPFYFLIYERQISTDQIILSLARGSLFSKPKDLLKVNTILNADEKVLYEKGRELSSNNYYDAKWTSFPTFIRSDGIFSTRFYFLETMMNKRTMYNQIDFDLYTQNVVKSYRNYGRVQL